MQTILKKSQVLKTVKKGISTTSCTFSPQKPPTILSHPEKGIYFDMQATTPIDPRVLDKMLFYQTEYYGNCHSNTHEFGWSVLHEVEDSRAEIARLIKTAGVAELAQNKEQLEEFLKTQEKDNMDYKKKRKLEKKVEKTMEKIKKEIIFTSGATESNNLAIKGTAFAELEKRKSGIEDARNTILVSPIEHKCVLETVKDLGKQHGFNWELIPIADDGLVDLDGFNDLVEKYKDDVLLVSTMMVNNEIGVIEPIKEMGEICEENGIILHCDAAQGIGKIDFDVKDLKIDLMSMSGHKIYGPKGIGGLFINREKNKNFKIKPILSGGGQESGLRSGTLPTHLAIGFGEACKIAREEMHRDEKHVEKLFHRLLDGITSRVEKVFVNGSIENRYKGNLNLSFDSVEGEAFILGLENHIYVSSGSACTSESLEPSYVLQAINIDEELAHTSIRFGFGRFTTEEEVDFVINQVSQSVERFRSIAPSFEELKALGFEFDDIDHH